MKKIILFILFILLIVLSNAQTLTQNICVTADCKGTISYPATSVSLNGSVTSTDGVKSVIWSIVSGPVFTAIDSPFNQATTARGLSAGGTYVYLLTATSNKGAVGTALDSVIYIPNQPPVAVVGPTSTVTVNTATLSGSKSTDPEGLSLTFNWIQSSGPNSAAISSPTMSNPIVSGLINGTYVFTLVVSDSGGLQSKANQTVIVNMVTQVKTVIVTTTVTTKYFSNNTTTSSSTTSTVTTVP